MAIRGAALAETAITLSFTLLLLFGTMQIAVFGYVQMQLDAATFQYAHQYAIGVTDPAGLNQVAAVFPNVPQSSMNFQAASAPTTSVPVNFVQWGQLINRFGGASIMRPQRLQTFSTLTIPGLSPFGNNVTFTSGNVEGRNMISNHDDNAQGVDPNSASAYGSQVNPFSQDDQNVPPYYFTFAFSWYCSAQNFGAGACPSQGMRSLGLAEYWKDGADSVDGNYDNPSSGVATGQTFAAMAFHQRMFANLELQFPVTWIAAQPLKPTGLFDENSPNSLSLNTIYKWDALGVYGSGGSGLGRQRPLTPLAGYVP
ncbi:MAG: hypothetical protein GIW98_02245 [Candidatus Eremiobacteraeota bacterium]|nr:hypothetical protein [Candidatus Eremiobacteraeota bacterium]